MNSSDSEKNSTSDAVLLLTESKKENDNKKTTYGSIGLIKTIHSMSNSKLLQKLEEVGFNLSAIRLIENYLTNRYQRVRVNDVYTLTTSKTQ